MFRKRASITLVPSNGLCNRMRAIASGKALSETLHSPLRVVWIQDGQLGARFADLFEPIDSVRFHECGHRAAKITRLRTLLIRQSRYSHRLRNLLYDAIIERPETYLLNNEKRILPLVGKRILINSYSVFYTPAHFSFRRFIPKKALAHEVEEGARPFDKHTAGIHVRRGDHLDSIRHSPTSKFIEVIEERIHQNADFNFYLATDCPQTEHILSRRFGRRVHLRAKDFSRSTAAGVKSALVDLYLLSKTNEVIGSCRSSFSYTAADIGNIQVRILGEDGEPDRGLPGWGRARSEIDQSFRGTAAS